MSNIINQPERADLRPLQLVFLAAAVFVVSAWLWRPAAAAARLAVVADAEFDTRRSCAACRMSGAYTVGVLVGAPIWGLISDRLGRPCILILGLVGYVASLLLLPSSTIQC
jgi:MFS family permease